MHRSLPLLLWALLLCMPAVLPGADAQIGNLLNCPASTIIGSTSPEQVHISLSDDSSQMQVSWATDAQTDSEIEWGLDGDLDNSAMGEEECYDHDMVFHKALMSDLQSASNYTYRVGDGSDWSPTFRFQTRDVSEDFTFLAFGDHGTSSEAMETSDMVLASEADFLILSGDISYANGEQSVWDDYLQYNQPSMAGMPWMMVPGNHENETGYGYDAYETRFEFPSASNTDLWHSFDYGPLHMVGFSTEHDYSAGSEQFQWLAADLGQANANREQVPWLIVYAHKPMYTSHGDSGHDEDAQLRALEPLFIDTGVDLVVWGHDHFYERSWPVENGEVMSRGDEGEGKVFSGSQAPIHLIVGTAGRDQYEYAEEQPEWSAYREQSHGILRVSVDIEGETLQVDYLRQDGNIGDSFILRQGEPVSSNEDDSMPAPTMLLSSAAILLAVFYRKWIETSTFGKDSRLDHYAGRKPHRDVQEQPAWAVQS